MNKDFERQASVLKVASFPGSHTASNIAEMPESVKGEFKIPRHKIHAIVRDNCANIVKAIKLTNNYSDISCFLHTLQLVVYEVIFVQRTIKDTIAICKHIVSHFSHSALAYHKLATLQLQHNIPQHKLLKYVPTQWSSTHTMLERIYEQKSAVASLCGYTQTSSP